MGKYKYIVWCNLIYKKIFHSQLKTYKNIYELLIMSRASCSDEFIIKWLMPNKKRKKKEKKRTERKKCLNFFFIIYQATRYTRYQSYKQHKGDTMSKLVNYNKRVNYIYEVYCYNYMMQENLFVYVEYPPVKHAASRFSVRKNVTKKKEKKEWHLDGLISQVQVLSIFYPEVPCTTLRWLYITL